MPIITCPKCQGKAKFPEDCPPRRVKCPSCGNVYLSTDGGAAAPAAPAFILKSRDSRPNLALDKRDAGRPRRRRDEDDYDLRSRRRSESTGRGTSSRRRDDDEDRRPRRRDEYDDNDRRPDPNAIEGRFNRSGLACLLCFIGGWLQVGSLGLLAFVFFLSWCGVREGLNVFAVIAGLLGLGHWLTSGTGLGFLVSGPRERGGLGLSIAMAATAALHLLLLIVIATWHYYGSFGPVGHGRTGEIYWNGFATQVSSLPTLFFAFIESEGRGTYGSVVPIIANLAEVARMVLLLLTLRAVMLCAHDSRGARLALRTLFGYGVAIAALLMVGILFGLVLLAVKPSTRPQLGDLQTISTVFHLFFIVLYSVLTGMAVGTTLVVKAIKGKIDYRR